MLALGRLGLVALVCCASSCLAETPSEPTSVTIPSGAVVTADPIPSSHDPLFGEPGPLRVRGYPTVFRDGMAALALRAGFTRDGQRLGVCWDDGGSESMSCRFVDRLGASNSFSIPFLYGKGVPMHAIDESDEHARWLAEQDVARLVLVGPEAWAFCSPPVSGAWRFARDLELHLLEVKGDERAGRQAELRVGGAVRGREPVFPITIRRPKVGDGDSPAGGTPVHFVRPTFFGLSPDRSELGLIVHSSIQEGDSTNTVHRWPVEDVAAPIYAAAAEAARRGGDAATASELCSLALRLRADAACEAASSPPAPSTP